MNHSAVRTRAIDCSAYESMHRICQVVLSQLQHVDHIQDAGPRRHNEAVCPPSLCLLGCPSPPH